MSVSEHEDSKTLHHIVSDDNTVQIFVRDKKTSIYLNSSTIKVGANMEEEPMTFGGFATEISLPNCTIGQKTLRNLAEAALRALSVIDARNNKGLK